MARLPNFRRIFKQDYEEEFHSLVDRLSVSLNIGLESLYSALNNRLTFADNFLATVRTVSVEVNSSGIPKVTTSFTTDTTTPLSGLLVIKSTNSTNPTTYPTGGINITYTQNNNQVLINHIAGLPADNSFQLTIVALG